MSRLIIKDLPPLGRSVLGRLRQTLVSSEDKRLEALAQQVPTYSDDERSRLVATGEYNAGKSSILSALTGVDIFIDSDVATSEARSYEWGDVLLVDTPGVKAGRTEHDEVAERALHDADLVVFVLTVDLFDDVTAAHLRHVAVELGKLDQTVVVINKAAAMAADSALRRAAVARALGFKPPCPIVECDARSALRAETADPARADHLRQVGNLAALEDALNDLVRRGGWAGRLKKPFQAALATVGQADLLLVPDSEEEAMDKLLQRWRDVLTRSGTRLHDNLEQAYRTLQEEVLDAGEQLIAAAAAGAVPDQALKDFQLASERSVERLPGLIEAVFDAELNELASEEEALAVGPEAQRLADALALGVTRMPGGPTSGDDLKSAFFDAIGDMAGEKGRSWLNQALRQGARPGAPMHTLVRKVGHLVQHRFKPHEIVKITKRLTVAISAGVVLFDIWSSVRQAQAEEKWAQEQQAELRRDVTAWTEELIDAARTEVNPIAEQFASQAARPADEIDARLERVRMGRARTQEVLDEVRRDSETALALLEFATTEGSA
jgi:GTP-binding protein EngB required for normal cell division